MTITHRTLGDLSSLETVKKALRDLEIERMQIINALNGMLNAGIFIVSDYGLLCDGETDNSPAFDALLAAVYAKGGGEIWFPPANNSYVFLSKWAIPNDGAATPAQPALRITGGGPSHAGQTSIIPGGAVVDLRFAGAVAKIDTRGLGFFELDHLTITDTGVSTTPFFQTTLTTCKIHDNSFRGNPTKSSTTCDQDAIILGGTGTVITGGPDDPFQGYGTVVYGNSFARIRRATYHRVYCNDVKVRDNWIMHDCGSNLADGACFEVDGAPAGVGSSASANSFEMNTIEVGSYPYPLKFLNSVHNYSAYNGFYDENLTLPIAFHKVDATSAFNLIVMGIGSDIKPTVEDDSGDTTTVITTHQNQASKFPFGLELGYITRMLNGEGPRIVDPGTDDYWYEVLTGGNQLDQKYKPVAAAEQGIWSLVAFSALLKLWTLRGAEWRIDAEGILQFIAGAGQPLKLGGNGAVAWHMTAAEQLAYVGASASPFALGAARPNVAGNWTTNGPTTGKALAAALASIGLIVDSTTT